MSLWLKSRTNHFYSIFYDNHPIRSQFCTCHDSGAVVTCAKLRPDLVTIVHVTATIDFRRLGYEFINHSWNGAVIAVVGPASRQIIGAARVSGCRRGVRETVKKTTPPLFPIWPQRFLICTLKWLKSKEIFLMEQPSLKVLKTHELANAIAWYD